MEDVKQQDGGQRPSEADKSEQITPAAPAKASEADRFHRHFEARRVGKDITLAVTQEDGPYLAIFPVDSSFAFAPDFSISDWPGMALCYTVTDGADKTVVVHWKHKTDFEAHGHDFEALTNRAPHVKGFATNVRKPRAGLWQRLALKTWILGLAALFGAFSAIQDYFARLVATPHVAVSFPSIGTAHFIEGAEIAVPVSISSELTLITQTVTFSAPEFKPSVSPIELAVDPAVALRLPPGQSAQVQVYGIAPNHNRQNKAPDIYELEVSVSTKAGWFISQESTKASRKIQVWPAAPSNTPFVFDGVKGNTCAFSGLLWASQAYPQGLQAEIIAVDANKQITTFDVTAGGATDNNSEVGQDGTTRKVTFRTPPLAGFQKYSYKIFLGLSSVPNDQSCRAWADQIYSQSSFQRH